MRMRQPVPFKEVSLEEISERNMAGAGCRMGVMWIGRAFLPPIP